MNSSGMRSITPALAVQCEGKAVTIYTNDEWFKVETQDGLEQYYRLSVLGSLSHWVKRNPNLLTVGISLLFAAVVFAGWVGLTPGIVLNPERLGVLGLLSASGLTLIASYFTNQTREVSLTFGQNTLKLQATKEVSDQLWIYLEQSYGLS
jgi:hypothetical protein